MTQAIKAQYIKECAAEIGFDDCGIARSETLPVEMLRYEKWLAKGYNAEMHYMHNHKAIRNNPELLIENAKSVIVTLSNYYPRALQNSEAPQVAKYAYGRDYHKVLLQKHKALLTKINEQLDCKGRIFVDSAPVMERTWAVKAGLGWIGKSSNLISPKLGTHTLISGIVIDEEIDIYDSPIKEKCGSCTRCIDACPTGAIGDEKIVDANKCLSYLTIEHRGDFNKDTQLHNNVFGCDKCIDACPFSKRIAHQIEDFHPRNKVLSMNSNDWADMNEDEFNAAFNGTPVKRAKYAGIQRNLKNL